MPRVVLIRHGESEWNKDNRFTGWVDVDLSEKGREEAREAARLLREGGYGFDRAFTSVLKRAVKTLWIILEEMDMVWLPVTNSWQLNERHYGALQGMNKAQAAGQFGEDQVKLWRRGFDVMPPENTERQLLLDRRYRHLEQFELPRGESLAMVKKRVLHYWERNIVPAVSAGGDVLVVAHGNSLRGLIMHLDQLSPEQVIGLNIPTGIPLVYEFSEAGLVESHFYLGSEDTLQAAQRAVANQGKVSA